MFSFRYECLSMSGWWASDHMGQTYFYRLIDVSICWPIAIKKTMFPNGPKLTAITFCDRKETSLRAMPMATIEKYLATREIFGCNVGWQPEKYFVAMPMATIEKYLATREIFGCNANGNHREIFGCNVVFRSGTTSTWRGTNLNMTTSLTSASLQNTSGNRICWCITGEFLNPSIKSGRPAWPDWHIPGKAENMLVCQSSLVVVIIIVYNFNNINITSALNGTLRRPWTSCFDVERGSGFANLESEDID